MIDTFHRIRLLHKAGVDITLHCFSNSRPPASELEKFCSKVYYHKRNTGFLKQFSLKPFIVKSRDSEKLLSRLTENDYPILFDGLHTTQLLPHPVLSGRVKIVRMHNIEQEYYKTLALNEKNIFKKGYFLLESSRIRNYEKVLSHANHILSVSAKDQAYFASRFHNSVLMPSSHPFDSIEISEGKGNYIIYHGDLSVSENSGVAAGIIKNIFAKSDISFIVAGKNPPGWLLRMAGELKNVQCIANPGDEEMRKLIREAHINILPVTRMNGLKLKLLYALYSGRHLIINNEMSEGLGSPDLYNVADNYSQMNIAINDLINIPFTAEMIKKREEYLRERFDNMVNINRLTSLF